jgi:4-hydroxybenzoate polyprenyltransferase
VNVAELVLLVTILPLPVLLGVYAGASRRPWWWAATASVIAFLLAAIAPSPEAGESRVAAGDIGFLVVVAAFIVGIAAAGAWVGRRLTRQSAEAGLSGR